MGLQVEEHETIKIVMDPHMETLLKKRGIKSEDIRKVIAAAEHLKNLFENTATGHILAYHRPSNVTYWVEYSRESGFYRIHRAYSHRMEILEGFNLPAKQKQTLSEWLCMECRVSLEPATVKLAYLEETFAAETLACPSCQRVFVSEAHAMDKMAQAEKMLEDK
jgi:hypothetical protein